MRVTNEADATMANEVRNGHIQSMGQDLGSVFHALRGEVAWIHVKWEEYRELFATKLSRVELLNKAAPLFFRIVQDALNEDILIHISRLTDSPKSVGKDNLTIRRLPGLISNTETAAQVQKLVDEALLKTEFCRDWRNRHIAHRDLALALEQGAIPLKDASREGIKNALEAIARVLNCVEAYYMDSDTYFEGFPNDGGALVLLHILDDGIQAKEDRRARRIRRELLPTDLRKREL